MSQGIAFPGGLGKAPESITVLKSGFFMAHLDRAGSAPPYGLNIRESKIRNPKSAIQN
jgi:hypothetical protein